MLYKIYKMYEIQILLCFDSKSFWQNIFSSISTRRAPFGVVRRLCCVGNSVDMCCLFNAPRRNPFQCRRLCWCVQYTRKTFRFFPFSRLLYDKRGITTAWSIWNITKKKKILSEICRWHVCEVLCFYIFLFSSKSLGAQWIEHMFTYPTYAFKLNWCWVYWME